MIQFENSYGSEKFEINFIKEFLGELIQDYKKNLTNSKTLMGLAKAFYIIDNFGKLNFDGYLRLEAGTRNKMGSNFYVLTIYSEEIILCQEGYEKNEFGGDTVYNEYFNSLTVEGDLEEKLKLKEWKDMFYDLSQQGLKFTIDDMVEDLEEVDSDESDEEE